MIALAILTALAIPALLITIVWLDQREREGRRHDQIRRMKGLPR